MLSTLAVIAMTGSIRWTESTYQLQSKMITLGWTKEDSKTIINECKKSAKDPRKCAIYAAAIGKNETQACQFAFKNSCFGVTRGYSSKTEAIKDWVKLWNKWWYKAQDASHFYGKNGIKPKTNYCLSEESSGTIGWCPNGHKNTTKFLAILGSK